MSVPAGRCGFVLGPEDAGVDLDDTTLTGLDDWYRRTEAVCCYRESWTGSVAGRCWWHATVKEKSDVSVSEPSAGQRLDGAFLVQAFLIDVDLSGVGLLGADLSGADLFDADLSGADLWEADLSGADLFDAGMSRTNLQRTGFTEAGLFDADLTGADLRGAELREADLRFADLSGSNLRFADLSGTDLRNSDLSKTDCADLEIDDASEVRASSQTQVSSSVPLLSGFRHRPLALRGQAGYWDARARGYERLRTVFREKGLDEHHRTLYSYQRRARAKEALRARQPIQWLGNYLSRALTGHGVRVSRVFLWTAVVLLAPWYWYGLVEGWAGESLRGGPLYYSVVTFVTAPPHPMPAVEGSVDLFPFAVDRGSLTRGVVLFQTYAGTALIVLLGYVLGNRDPI